MINKAIALNYILNMRNNNWNQIQYVKGQIDQGIPVTEARKTFLRNEHNRLSELVEFISNLPDDNSQQAEDFGELPW